jgi:P4 family phage/plasmid primase-like protien
LDDAGKEVKDERLAVNWKPSRIGFVSALTETFSFLTIRDTEESLLYDDRGLYNGGAATFIKEWIERRFLERGKTADHRFCTETYDSIRRRTYRERESLNPPGRLCLWNGILNLTGETPVSLDPHNPSEPFVTRLPVIYDPAATCPRFVAFLERVLPDERWRTIIQEMFGYCLKPGNPFKTAFFLIGPPDCGKSTLLEVLRGILGSENTSTVALQSLSDNRFAGASLFGKLANIYTDLSPKLIRDAGLFKMLTGGSDHVPGEKKFQQPFSFVNPAKLLFSANAMPAVPWGDEAFFRRWAVIEFQVRVPSTEQRPFYESELLEEASGILNWALAGLARLESRGRFDTEGILANTSTRWRRLSDSLAWFADEGVVRDRGEWMTKADFYAAYTEFCEERGVEARSQTDVGKEIPQLIPGVKAGFPKVGGKGGKTQRAWMGLRLRTSSDPVSGNELSRYDTEGSTGSTGSTPMSSITPTRARENNNIPEPPVEQVEPVEPISSVQAHDAPGANPPSEISDGGEPVIQQISGKNGLSGAPKGVTGAPESMPAEPGSWLEPPVRIPARGQGSGLVATPPAPPAPDPWPAPKEAPYEPPPGLSYAYEAAQEWVAAQQGAPFCLVDLEKFLLDGGHQVAAVNGACGRICGNGTIRRLKDGRWIATGEPDPPPEKAPPTPVVEEQDPGAPPPEPAGEDDPLDGVLPEPDKWGRWKHGTRTGWHLKCPPCGRPGHNCSTCPSCREQEAAWRRKHPEG